jgi:hypothetical protein
MWAEASVVALGRWAVAKHAADRRAEGERRTLQRLRWEGKPHRVEMRGGDDSELERLGQSFAVAPKRLHQRQRKELISRDFVKPSDGLEPSTPPDHALQNRCRGLPPVADRPI